MSHVITTSDVNFNYLVEVVSTNYLVEAVFSTVKLHFSPFPYSIFWKWVIKSSQHREGEIPGASQVALVVSKLPDNTGDIKRWVRFLGRGKGGWASSTGWGNVLGEGVDLYPCYFWCFYRGGVFSLFTYLYQYTLMFKYYIPWIIVQYHKLDNFFLQPF